MFNCLLSCLFNDLALSMVLHCQTEVSPPLLPEQCIIAYLLSL
nr:MAG TPA: hypothetical protein [Bacteriophage sp.]